MKLFSNPNYPWPYGKTIIVLATAVSVAIITSNDSMPPPAGRLLASQCFQCHGTDGQAVSGFEPITGRSANDMYKTLLEMSQRRSENIMDLQARAYTPAQLRLIAEYLATLPVNDETLSE